MESSILLGITNIAKYRNLAIKSTKQKYKISINTVGQPLEDFVSDAIAGALGVGEEERTNLHGKTFSYLGNQNNPPDAIIKNGDAFEIKKIESLRSGLALNSSPPKNILHSSDPRLTDACRKCENGWKEKDLFYVVGSVQKSTIKYLFFVHGLCYAADKEVYEKIHSTVKSDIKAALQKRGIEMGETVELGKVKKVDPLGITEFRMRGMWSIENPINVFSSVYQFNQDAEFSLIALMTKEKFEAFPREHSKKLMEQKDIFVKDVIIKDPNNPAKKLTAKLITLSW